MRDQFFSHHPPLVKLSSSALLVSITLAILTFFIIFYKGMSGLSLQFLLESTRQSGLGGGIRYQILGTTLLIVTTGILVYPVSLSFSFLSILHERNRRLHTFMETLLLILNVTPSIIFGFLGYQLFVLYLEWGKSWLAGSLILALMILPTCSFFLLERIKRTPKEIVESAKSLGLSQVDLCWHVYLPRLKGATLHGLFLGLARAAGETAPIMFVATVFFGAELPTGIRDNPVVALPYHIFQLSQESFHSAALQNVWASALVLVLMALGLQIPFLMMSLRKVVSSHGTNDEH